MNCITQIHNVKNTLIYFIVAGSLIGSPAQLHECLQPTLSLHRPLQPIFTAGCACVYTTSSSSDCCLPWSIAGGTTEDHNSPCSTADPPQHCRPPTALAKDHMVVDAVEPHGLSRLCVSPPLLELSHNSVLGALKHYTQGHSTFRGTLACRRRSFHTEVSSYSLEEVTAAS